MSPIVVLVSEVGYTWDEVLQPVVEFEKAGYDVVIATPNGQSPKPDPSSVQCFKLLHLIGYGTHKSRSQTSDNGQKLMAKFASPTPLAELTADDYAAIYIAGGHGALFDLHGNAKLNQLLADFYRQKKAIGALCHSSSILCEVDIDGKSVAQRHRLTGFPTAMEHFILTMGMVDKQFHPMPMWTGKCLDQDTCKRPVWFRVFEVLNLFTSVADGQIITGVGPKSSKPVARKMLAAIAD